MNDDGSNGEGLRERQTTGEDRVRMVARQLSEPRTANWIATEADWSHEPTKRVLERLVNDGILHRDESGTHTTYYPDYRRQAMQEAMRLRDSGHTVEELTDRLAEMKAQVRDWEEEFGVEVDVIDSLGMFEHRYETANVRGVKTKHYPANGYVVKLNPSRIQIDE